MSWKPKMACTPGSTMRHSSSRKLAACESFTCSPVSLVTPNPPVRLRSALVIPDSRTREEIPVQPQRSVRVYVDWRGELRLAGRLHAYVEGDREWAELEPDARWRAWPHARLAAPMLAL